MMSGGTPISGNPYIYKWDNPLRELRSPYDHQLVFTWDDPPCKVGPATLRCQTFYWEIPVAEMEVSSSQSIDLIVRHLLTMAFRG